MTNMWMVRAGKNAFLIDEFKENNIVAIGWGLGNLKDKSKEEIEELVYEKYPNKTKNQNTIIVAQEYKFLKDIKKGDYVLSYNPGTRNYLLGKITSNYYFSDIISKTLDDDDYSDVRNVKWLDDIPRDKLNISTKNTLGAISTLFNINNEAKKDILNIFEGKESGDDSGEDSILVDEIEEKSKEFIKDIVNSLDGYEMQDLVAALLRAMGYKTIVSTPGPDRGRDIQTMSAPNIRSFKGALKKTNKGIYVSTGGFTSEAKYEAERSEIPIILMDLDRLVKFIMQYYDNFDADGRSLLPLKKIYWPIK